MAESKSVTTPPAPGALDLDALERRYASAISEFYACTRLKSYPDDIRAYVAALRRERDWLYAHLRTDDERRVFEEAMRAEARREHGSDDDGGGENG